MTEPERNAHHQPVGARLDGWTPPPAPPRIALAGHHAAVVPLDVQAHATARRGLGARRTVRAPASRCGQAAGRSMG